MEENLRVEIGDDFQLDADLPIVKLLRLQQIACNYLPTENEEEPYLQLSEENPRLKALKSICEGFISSCYYMVKVP